MSGDIFDKIKEMPDKIKEKIEGKKEDTVTAPVEEGTADTGAITKYDSLDEQAAQRRLARMSKYFTTPSGVMNDGATGKTGVLS